MCRVRRGHRSCIGIVHVPWAPHLCFDGLDMDVSAGFSSLQETEVDESADPVWMVAAAASGGPIFGMVATTPCHERGGLELPLHRQSVHHGWTWPRIPRIRWSSKSLNAGSRSLFALSLAPALFMPPAACSSLISLSWFPSPLPYLRPPSTSRSLLHGGHTIREVGIGRDASLALRCRLFGGANNKGTSFPQFHEWYCVRCQRGGCWATKFSCFRCGLSRLESEAATGGFHQPTSKGGGKEKGVFREAQYPGRSRGGDGMPRNIPPTTRRVPDPGNTPVGSAVQIDQLIGGGCQG